MKIFIATALSFFLLFFTWIESYRLSCLALLFPVVMLAVVTYGYYELKMHQRRCFAKCYLKKDTFASKIFVSKSYFILLFYTILTTAMVASTFTVVMGFSKLLWVYFFIHILLSYILFIFLSKRLKYALNEEYNLLFAREWTINIMALLLIVVFTYITLNTYTPTYLSSSLEQTITNAMASSSSSCEIIDSILKYTKVADSTFWWIVNESTTQINNTLLKTFIWIVFILYNSLALLGINRLIIVSLYLFTKSNILKNEKEHGEYNV